MHRRDFLADFGMGFTGLAMGAMLADDVARAEPDGHCHFPPRAKSIIWVFLSGGYSHTETFATSHVDQDPPQEPRSRDQVAAGALPTLFQSLRDGPSSQC